MVAPDGEERLSEPSNTSPSSRFLLLASAVLLAVILAVVCVRLPPSPASSAPSADIALRFTSHLSQPVPDDFLSFSFESTVYPRSWPWSLDAFTANQDFFATLLSYLVVEKGASKGPSVRVGGDSATQAYYTSPDSNAPSGFDFVLRPSLFEALAQAVQRWNGSVAIGLNMAQVANASVAVSLVRDMLRLLPPSILESFELGQEPDLFPYQYAGGELVRPAPYGSDSYTDDVAFFVNALVADARLPPRMLRQPSISAVCDWSPAWLQRFALQFVRQLHSVAVHAYPWSTCDCDFYAAHCDVDIDTERILDDAPLRASLRVVALHASAVASSPALQHLPFHVGEGDLVCGPSSGLYTIGGALAQLNYFLMLASAGGVRRFHTHNPRWWTCNEGGGAVQVNAMFYGAMAFAAATAHGTRLLPSVAVAGDAPRLRAYAGIDALGSVRTTLINKGGLSVRVVLRPDPSQRAAGSAASVMQLRSSADLFSTRGISWRGLSWDNSTDGRPVGVAPATPSVHAAEDGAFRLTVAPHSALVIVWQPDASNPSAV